MAGEQSGTNSEIDFLQAIKERENQVIQKIYDRFFGKVIGFVVKNKGTKEDAKDVFDKAIYQISARLNREDFQVKSSFEAFLFTACKNLWRRELNIRVKRRVTSGTVKELYYEQKQLVQATLEQERWELFHEKLKEISINCQQILKLFFSKMSGKDIMRQMNYASETTVRQRIFKCKQQLIAEVKKDPRYVELKNI